MRSPTLALFAICVSMTLACSSQLGLGRARTMDAGKHKVNTGFELDVVSAQTGQEQAIPLPWTQAAAGYHVGATDRVEVGARLWGFTVPRVLTTYGAAVDTKIGVIRPDKGKGKFQAATGLSLAYHQARYGGQPNHVFGVTVPVLLGMSMGRHELTFGPRVADYVWTSYGQNTVNTFHAGGSIAMSIALRETFELVPEVVVLYSPVSFNGEVESERGVTTLQLGVGGSWQL
jgi:hypothetical protein